MIAGVAIDPWKLEIFKRHLDKAGFKYEVTVGDPITVISVTTEYAFILQPIIEAAQRECARGDKS